MSKRQEDFFNEATKQIRDSYVFQNDETYSDDDVRDIATSLAEYGYQYAIDNVCNYFKRIKECDFYEDKESQANAVDDFINRLRKTMQ